MITPARALLLAASISLAVGCGDSPDALLASAKDYLAKQDTSAAVIQLKNVLAKKPDSAEARFLLGKALLDSGDAAAAEIELVKARELNYPADAVIPLLARAYLAQGQFKKLEALAATPIATSDGLAELKTTLAQAQAAQGQLAAARKLFEEALAASEQHAPAWLGLAQLKAAEQDLAGAHRIVQDLLARDDKNAAAWLFQADLLRAEGKLPEAVAAYEKGLTLAPRALAAHGALIMIHLGERQVERAVKQLEAMQKLAAQHPLTLYMQALTAYARQDLAAARSAVEALLKGQPDNPLGLQLAGQIAYDSRNDLQAQEYLRKALQRTPTLDFARRTLALSYLRSGQPAKALETLQPALQGSPRPEWLTLAGNAHLQNGDLKSAEEFFRRAAQADPSDKRAQTALALARLRSGRSEEALADLQQIAAQDSGIAADLALIATHIRERRYDQALAAIDQLEKKQAGSPVPHNLRGGALLGKGERNAARQSFEKALAIDAAYLPAAVALAQLDLAEQKPEAARKRFESVLAKDPKNAQALLAIAELMARSGAKAEEIAAQIGKAIAAAPNELAPRLALIQHHLRQKDNKKALSAAQEALSALPDRPELLDVAGQVYQLNGDTEQALATYGKLAGLLPSSVQPYLRMAEIHMANKNKEGARASLNKGLANHPDALPLLRALIMLDVEDKNFSAALAKTREIQKKQPKSAAGHALEGDVHLIAQAWDKAAEAYRAGLKIAPSTDLAQRLYTALLRGGKAAEANRHAESWLAAHPKDNGFRLFLAEAANQRQDYAGAARHYRAILQLEPDNPALLNNLAWALGKLKDPKALELAERAHQLAPNQPAIMDTLGVLLVDKGDLQRGLELIGKALALAPQAAEIRLNYAKALIKANRKEEARKELDTLSQLGERFPLQAEVAALLKSL